MTWHPSHTTRVSDSSHYDMVCDDCGATDGRGHEHLMRGPCGMPEQTEEFFQKARKVAPKEMLYKLLYGGEPDGAKWLASLQTSTRVRTR